MKVSDILVTFTISSAGDVSPADRIRDTKLFIVGILKDIEMVFGIMN